MLLIVLFVPFVWRGLAALLGGAHLALTTLANRPTLRGEKPTVPNQIHRFKHLKILIS